MGAAARSGGVVTRKNERDRPTRAGRLLVLGLLAAFAVACEPSRPAPGPPEPTPRPTLAALPSFPDLRPPGGAGGPGLPPAPPGGIDLSRLPRWSRGEMVSIMALGIDRRGHEPPRSDTMLLATFDLAGRQARVVSIPRDLLVEIPGVGLDRINAAFSAGEQERPGMGPLRTKQVVEQNFQVSVPHWVVIDFACFRTAIDVVGGAYVDIPARIVDAEYPDELYGTMVISFDPGFQLLDGERALQYVRTRHGDSDFGRMRRQQQVLSALRDQLLTIHGVTNLPTLIEGCRGFSSDLPLIELVGLAFSARSIPDDNLRLTVIDERMARPTQLPTGASVLSPNWDAIRPVVREAMPARR